MMERLSAKRISSGALPRGACRDAAGEPFFFLATVIGLGRYDIPSRNFLYGVMVITRITWYLISKTTTADLR